MSKKPQLLASPPAPFESVASLSGQQILDLDRPATMLERLFPLVAIPVSILLVIFVAMLPMTWQQQAIFGILFITTAWLLHRSRGGRTITLGIALFSLCATARYGYWRGNTLYEYLLSPWQHVHLLNAVFMLLLLGAEFYSFFILVLGFMQTIVPLRRPVKPLPADRSTWPTVDIMIPTFNEPLEIVRYTVLAAQEIDWPTDRLTITILDDGEREQFQEFAAQAGVGYIARTEHSGAKAGNLNNAIDQHLGEYIAIFDCDHVPTRSFLQLTMGWFLVDQDLALMQTPHHFYSPDPFERNLDQFRTTPNEGSLFYSIVQDANDLWNAAFFCGSCAVIRRTALEEVGGIAQDTVTEDAHTSLRLQRAGWNTAYINIAQAAGLATETLAGHVRQRIRWARGMAQILRTDNPLFGGGLRVSQRLCYLNATLHYLYGIPRILFLTAPLLYLFFGLSNVPGYWAAILAFALPHLFLSNIANSRIQGSYRHSFWNEIYETVLAPYILLPTTVALIAPKHGKFNVTAKGGLQDDNYFDRKIAAPFLVLVVLNIAGICLAVPRYLYWDPGHAGTIAINVFWTIFNLIILGTALAVCYEHKQRRESTRVPCSMPVRLHTETGVLNGTVTNVSNGGVAVKTTGQWKPGAVARIEFADQAEAIFLEAEVRSHKAKQVRFQFTGTLLEDERKLTRILYAVPNRWAGSYAEESQDRPFRSLARIFRLSLLGFWRVMSTSSEPVSKRDEDDLEAPVRPSGKRKSIAAAIVLTVLFHPARSSRADSHASQRSANSVSAPATPAHATVPQSFSLSDVSTESLLLQQPGSRAFIRFTIPNTWFIQSGTLHLRYALPNPGQINGNDQFSVAEVRLNDALLASVLPSRQELANGVGELDVPLPAEMLVRRNILTIQLAGDDNAACTRKTQASVPLRIDPSSRITLNAFPLHITSDLHALPHPFLEHLAGSPAIIPVVFARQPSSSTLQAAGILASWFGIQDDETQMQFPARVASLPSGNAVVLLTGSETLDGIVLPNGDQRSVSLIDNPVDPYGKLLVLRGRTDEDLVEAAQSLVIDQKNLTGSNTSLQSINLPPERSPDDAPRWIHTNRIALSQLMSAVDRKTAGPNPINLYMHLAPDYNFGSQQRMYLHLNYATDAQSIGKTSNITARLNGQPIDSYPLRTGHSARPIDIPMVEIPAATYANTLQIQFYFASSGSGCALPVGHTDAEVLGSSFLDMGGAVHHASMPNLNLFAKAGFPFTRIADLSETAVLLPDNPSLEAISLYLDLISYFGAQTGYPALRVQVGSIAQAEEFSDKDLLVLGSFDDLSASPRLGNKLPASFVDDGVSFSFFSRLGVLTKALSTFDFRDAGSVRDSESHSADGLIAGFESPFTSGRSVVLALARQNDQVLPLATSMISAMPGKAIDETVTLWSSGGFHSYPLLTNPYFVGTLPWHENLRYSLPQLPLLLIAALLLIAFVIGSWASRWFSYRVRRRLRPFSIPIEDDPSVSSARP
jgi:cellulose synthase (UDP-forming)